ncbi:MAG: TonB-dependent receptor [Winogradskyella sp.]|uniref:SusC/RagA family TonB-linked outer membrane protein n=1 Tax=Winogradskyella sp. TaxID=1883156 RepID=UPI001799A82C|nr:TonB-dependent receptor [Winogradskyella sp.]MBT8245041.1 TonB-dependent receptor [Winogradskyella sp.]NNK22117.1 TonB-dependent receptor [Winogradskyella sp.]
MNLKIFTIFFAFFASVVYAQNIDVRGTVVEASTGGPLPGVNVILKNTTKGTSTDFDGNFTLSDVPLNSTLVFSYVGFKTQEVTIIDANPITVNLVEDAESLNEIVVIGYGTQKKKEVTGAVSVISSSTIEELKPTRVEQALQGQVAGVNITSTSGAPGAGLTINIRGVSTNGDNRPLILVDGNVIEDLSVLNPNDIESVNVLKDATAGIYGVRAANGVILIKTKTGRKNMPLTVEINAFGGFQQTTRKLPTLNATEYALLANEAFAAAGDPLPFTNVADLGQGTDWQDEIFQNAAQYSTAVSIRGGSENQTFAYGSSIFSQDGIVGGNSANFTRFNQSLNYSLDFLDNFKFNAGVIWNYTNRNRLNEGGIGSVLFNALNIAPTIEGVRGALAEGLGNEVINPLDQIADTYDRGQVNRISGVVGLSYNFLNDFTAQVNYQFNYSDDKAKIFRPSRNYGSGKVFNVNRGREEIVETANIFRDYTFDAFLKYEKLYDDTHNVKVLLGTSIFKSEGFYRGFRGFGIPSNSIQDASIENATESESLFVGLPNNPFFDSRLLSYFGRFQYDYKGKYLLSAVIRRDGSSNFGPENKFGWFPSVSTGWVASDEDFLADNNFIDFLKVRASYGILGNDRIPTFAFVSTLGGEATYVYNNTRAFGVATGIIANPGIKWEKQKTFDVGIDARFLNNRFDLTLDYYKRRTEDLLITSPVSGLLGPNAPGALPPVVNAGIIENSGLEIALGYSNDPTNEFKVSARFNMTTLNNEVIEVAEDVDFVPGGAFSIGQDFPSRMEAGLPIGYFRGFKTAGIYQTQSEIDNSATINDNVRPGDLIFVDINNDGVIDDDDRTNIGNPIPDMTFGLNLNLEYKNFDFIAYAFASVGNDIVRNYERNERLTNRTINYLDRWTGPGTSNTFPRVTTGANSNILFSDFYVEDGSFVRLQNVQLGYSLSDDFLEDSTISKMRFYVSVQNLFTLTEYQGYDPTTSSGAPIGGGIDNGFYPNPRTFLLGMNLKF